jgi:hypothetical protein
MNQNFSIPRTILNANLLPLLNLECTPIIPSKAFTIFSQITSPNPIPYVFICLVFYKVPKSLNNFTLSLVLIPIPESITEITILSLFFIGSNTNFMP